MTERFFSPELFRFLRELDANNERPWFEENKDRYERHVREPALRFIDEMTKPLHSISSHFEADSRTVGGSLMRIHRDVRFSKDKTPYKTNVGIQFRHEAGTDIHAPGFYLNLEPGECFVGVGIWHPHTAVQYRIREHIDAHQAEWKKATRGKRFADEFELRGDSLTRPPKGFDADHPYIEDLKRKDFLASTRLTQKDVTSQDFQKLFVDRCKRSAPFMQFLCDAVGVPF